MNIPDYIKSIQKMNTEMVEIQSSINSIVDENESLDSLLDILHKYDIFDNKSKFHDFLNLLNILAYSRKKTKDNNKMSEILLNYKTQITQTFTKKEIFFIFYNNAPFLYDLCQNNIIDLNQILESKKHYFYRFFLPEYVNHYGIEKANTLLSGAVEKNKDNFDQFCLNRKEYHSDLEVAKLIRSDDLDSFIEYISRTNLNLDTKIPYSIYEIDYELHNYYNCLIEYAAIFESVKIFKYLYDNLDTLPENILTAAIYGGNFEIIHLLEDKGIEPDHDSLFRTIIKHRNKLFDYFISKYNIELDFLLAEESVNLLNYYTFNEILKKKPNFLTNTNFLNKIFLSACVSNIWILIDILYYIPDVDVNIKGEIILFLFSFEIFFDIIIYSNSPLHYAATGNNVYVVKKLLKHPKINVNSGDYISIFSFDWISNYHLNNVSFFKFNSTPIYVAAVNFSFD